MDYWDWKRSVKKDQADPRERDNRGAEHLINHSLSPMWLTFLLPGHSPASIYPLAWLDVEIHRGH